MSDKTETDGRSEKKLLRKEALLNQIRLQKQELKDNPDMVAFANKVEEKSKPK